jgi:hypothetical protein
MLARGRLNRQDQSVAKRDDDSPASDITGPLRPGVRVSLELPESGSCVAVVASVQGTDLLLDLLDDIPDDEIDPGVTTDLFMPRTEGIYHWACALRSAPIGQKAEVELLSLPVFVQRRLAQRWEAELQAEVRRISAARRGKAHEMLVADLSQGGMKLEGPFQLSTGDTLEITVDLGTPVQLVGRTVMAYPLSQVTWAAHVSFLDGQREVMEAVNGFIAHRFRRLSG